MPQRNWFLYGLVYVLFTPVVALSQVAIWEIRASTLFPPIALSAVYPLGLLLFVLGPQVFRPGSFESSEGHIEFSKGTRFATLIIFAVSIPVGLVTMISFPQSFVGFSLILIGLGSLVLPEASVAGTVGYLIAKGNSMEEFRRRANEYPLNYETRVISWISVYLGRLPARWSASLGLAAILEGSFFLGWILLSFSGGFPATLFGITVGVLVPVSSQGAFRRRTTRDERQSLAKILSPIENKRP